MTYRGHGLTPDKPASRQPGAERPISDRVEEITIPPGIAGLHASEGEFPLLIRRNGNFIEGSFRREIFAVQ